MPRFSPPRRCQCTAIGALFLMIATASPLVPAADRPADATFDESAGITLFAFDQVAIPFSQNLRLEMRSPVRHPANPVLACGAPGEPDAQGVQFYGSVIREGDKFRMWYVAFDDDTANPVASARWRAAYAESRDGLHWTRPNLGLVEYGGNKDNNLILTDPAPLGFVNVKVLADANDPDPRRRYKISTHVYFRSSRRLGTLAPFASPDGLRWKLLTPASGGSETSPLPQAGEGLGVRAGIAGVVTRNAELLEKDLVLPAVHFEPCGGLYKWDGMYYACGQNAMNALLPYQGRVARTYRSPDFVHWSATSNLAFVRTPQYVPLGPGRSLEGEQTHEGISVWNRGNVLVGLYGRWHGAKEWKDVTIDLGLVVSNDGLSFREPAHEWTFLKRGEDGAWDQGGLIQGQGFENVGDETFIYYGAWDPRHWQDSPKRGGVGIAVLPRDRFADLVVEEAGQGTGDYQLPVVQSEFVTASIPTTPGHPHRFYLNADGLGPQSYLKIELLDAHERPLAGFSGPNAAIVRKSGFHTPILWDGKQAVEGLPERVRVRAGFEGEERAGIRFSAMYVQDDAAKK